MLRALYDFQAPYENTLTFVENDLFVVLKRNNKDNDWVHVIDLKGENGYAPSNYLTVANCTKSEEIKHIDAILALLASKRSPSRDQANVVENLLESKGKLEKELEDLAAKQMYELTSVVRQTTSCTFRQAQGAIVEALKYFRENVLPIPNGLDRILNTDSDKISLEIRRSCGADGQRLDQLVNVIMEFASDQETEVSEETWNEMLTLVTHADPVLLIAALERHDCALILQLVHRLQAETSWRKRKLILAIIFHALQLSTTFVNVAINSVLPSELARDIQAVNFSAQDANKERLCWSIRVLTVALCCKEPLSFAQQNELGDELVELLINTLETESVSIATTDERDNECLASTVMHLILALHRQFAIVSQESNPVLHCLGKRSMCDSLVEKIILLYNREDDPIKKYVRDEDEQTDAVSNLMLGLFSGPETAKLFYTADLDVLLDVILRRLTDYGPGDTRRSDALQLYYAIQRIKSPTYKKLEFAKCLKMMSEESSRLGSSSTAMQQDHCRIMQIYHEFPDLLLESS